eukprot:scaffold76709_cov69-Phaeocystis_antarctica.AAC.3
MPVGPLRRPHDAGSCVFCLAFCLAPVLAPASRAVLVSVVEPPPRCCCASGRDLRTHWELAVRRGSGEGLRRRLLRYGRGRRLVLGRGRRLIRVDLLPGLGLLRSRQLGRLPSRLLGRVRATRFRVSTVRGFRLPGSHRCRICRRRSAEPAS